MPSAPEWLRAKFMTDEEDGINKAELVLACHYTISPKGVISLLESSKGHKMTQEEYEAILFLIHEWDYAYDKENG